MKVLCFNVWGLHYVSLRIRERLGYIAEELKSYDIIGLQEVWSKEDYVFLVDKLKNTFPYYHYYHCGIIGSGLCVFSRHPIMAAHSHQFTLTGGVRDIADGEIFAGKGILLTRLKTPEGAVAFYNTHTNPRCRDSQLFEVLQFVEQTRGADPVILVGDFNTKPRHTAYSLLTRCLGLRDVFEADPVDTCDLTSNIFTDRKRMTPKRIDFILYSDEFATSHTIQLKDHRLALSGHIPGKDFPYSDHEGVEATFELCRREFPIPVKERIFDDEAVLVLEEISKQLEQRKQKFYSSTSWTIGWWVCLLIINIIVAILLNSQSVYSFLSAFYLPWLPTVLCSLLAAVSVFSVIENFSTGYMAMGLQANVEEIQTLLKYNKSLVRRDNYIASSPGHSHVFNVARRKEGGPGI